MTTTTTVSRRKDGSVTVTVDGTTVLALTDHGGGMQVSMSACLPVNVKQAASIVRAYTAAFILAGY